MRHEEFVHFLQSLEFRGDRAALARLRRGLGRPNPDLELIRVIARFLPAGSSDGSLRERRVYCLVASLFALHPLPGGRGNLGDSFRRMGAHESIQKRFIALLKCHFEELPHRLRAAASLADANEVPIDWLRLLTDLLRWDADDKPVQVQWARSYWGHTDAAADGVEATSEAEYGHVR